MPLASNPDECDSPAPIYRLSMRKLNYIILSIVVLVRWFKMTNNVEQILQHLTHANPKLTYLIAIGETEQAQKAALTMLVEKMYSIYYNQYVYSKAEEMKGQRRSSVAGLTEDDRQTVDKERQVGDPMQLRTELLNL